MNIFPIQGLTEDRCAYGRTQGVLLPLWNTKDCPASVFQMQMIWYCWCWWFDSSQRNVLRRQWSRFGEKIWQNLNYPFAISHVPFPSRQCHPCSPPTRIDANKIMGLPASQWDLTSAHLISFISIAITVKVKLSPRLGELPFQVSGKKRDLSHLKGGGAQLFEKQGVILKLEEGHNWLRWRLCLS